MEEVLQQKGLYFRLLHRQEGLAVDSQGRAQVADAAALRCLWPLAAAQQAALQRCGAGRLQGGWFEQEINTFFGVWGGPGGVCHRRIKL